MSLSSKVQMCEGLPVRGRGVLKLMDLCETEKPNYDSERENFSLIFQGFFYCGTITILHYLALLC